MRPGPGSSLLGRAFVNRSRGLLDDGFEFREDRRVGWQSGVGDGEGSSAILRDIFDDVAQVAVNVGDARDDIEPKVVADASDDFVYVLPLESAGYLRQRAASRPARRIVAAWRGHIDNEMPVGDLVWAGGAPARYVSASASKRA